MHEYSKINPHSVTLHLIYIRNTETEKNLFNKFECYLNEHPPKLKPLHTYFKFMPANCLDDIWITFLLFVFQMLFEHEYFVLLHV